MAVATLRRSGLAIVVTIGGCGRVGFDATATDAELPILPAAFDSVTMIAELAVDAHDDDATLTSDQLEMFFASTRRSGIEGNGDIMTTTRARVSDPWGPPVYVEELDTQSNEESPGVSPDGLTLWFARTITLDNPDIYVSTRPNRASAWSAPVLVSELTTTDLDLSPEPARSMLRLAFYRESPRVIFETTRETPTSPWGAPRRLSDLAATGWGHKSPFFVSDRELWFASEESGLYDLARAIRASVDEPFGPEEVVQGTNRPQDNDDDPWISPDGMTLYFTSTRSGFQHIYTARRVLD